MIIRHIMMSCCFEVRAKRSTEEVRKGLAERESERERERIDKNDTHSSRIGNKGRSVKYKTP
jgi:hypothetical protein